MASFPEVELIPKESDENPEATAAHRPPAPLAEALPPASEVCDPEAAPVCPAEEFNSPHRCVALSLNGQLLSDQEQVSAWAKTPCQAHRELFKIACANHLNYAQLDKISCHPDANEGNCPAALNDCPNKVTPTRCFAKSYEEQDLNWSSRPEAWGRNECDARNKLNKTACNLGLDPKALKAIRCEPEPSTLVCPPLWKNCDTQKSEFSECSLSRVGEIVLKKPLKAIGSSRCEATYRVQDLACRFQKAEIKELAGVECRALTKPGSNVNASSKPGQNTGNRAIK